MRNKCKSCGKEFDDDLIQCSSCKMTFCDGCYLKHLPCSAGDDEPFLERDKHKEFYEKEDELER